jgi:hypothetical protein
VFLHHVLGDSDFGTKQDECCSTTRKGKAGVRRYSQILWGNGSSTGHDSCMASHVIRSGQPAVTQAFSSSGRQNTLRPMRIGRGVFPVESQVRQVRIEMLQSAAAFGARRRSGVSDSVLDGRQTPLGTMLSVGAAILPIRWLVVRFDMDKHKPRTDRVLLFLELPGRRPN